MINGRTAEEIKRWLRWVTYRCDQTEDRCATCEYRDDCREYCGSDTYKDALALIERLEAAQPRWISVEEKMPPEDTEVLVYATEKIKGFGSVTAICEYRETTSIFCNKTGRYDWSSPWEYFHVDYKITHWMPLPEPPKEGA